MKEASASSLTPCECGIPDGDAEGFDTDRIVWLRACLAQLQRATAEGVPVRGWFHWSTMRRAPEELVIVWSTLGSADEQPPEVASAASTACEHTFAVTSQGSAYGRFRRALDRGNVLAALSAAAELQHVSLVDALALLLLLARTDMARFQRAALRWHARYCRELCVHDPGEAQVTLALLFMLAGPSSSAVARALAELLQARDFGQAAEALTTWAEKAR